MEAVVWTAGLVALACTNPDQEGLFSLCVFKWLGFSFCPGCGLGHAVAYLFHGELIHSFQAHPLGPFAVPVLVGRIVSLVYRSINPPDQTLNHHVESNQIHARVGGR